MSKSTLAFVTGCIVSGCFAVSGYIIGGLPGEIVGILLSVPVNIFLGMYISKNIQ